MAPPTVVFARLKGRQEIVTYDPALTGCTHIGERFPNFSALRVTTATYKL